MRRFKKDANIEMITMGIIAAVMFAIAIPIIFNVAGSLDLTTIDTKLKENVYGQTYPADGGTAANASQAAYNVTLPSANATDNVLTQINSFFAIGPIYLVVVVAVGIIAAILVLRRFGAA